MECAVVKWGLGRNKARCLPPSKAQDLVRETAQQAVRGAAECKPFKPSLPATIQLTLYRSDMADEVAARPGTERVDARTVRRQIHSLLDVCRW